MKTISIVTPCYNEELNVRECHAAIKALFENEFKGYRREHVFCDNASTDRTAEILREIAAQDTTSRSSSMRAISARCARITMA